MLAASPHCWAGLASSSRLATQPAPLLLCPALLHAQDSLKYLLPSACAVALWSWRNQRKLEKLDERINRQSELIEQLDSVLENPPLSEAEQLAKSEALLAKLQETRKP